MSPATLDAPPGLFGDLRASGDMRANGSAGGRRVTLEEHLDAAWRAVCTDGEAECPVCRATMRHEGGAGRCTGCGSTLA